MGAVISAVGGVIKMAKAILVDEDPEKLAAMQERLSFLQKMANTTLDGKINDILHGQEGDLKIHGGTIVEVHKRVEIKHEDSSKTVDDVIDATLNDSLEGVFSDRSKKSIGGLIKGVVHCFFTNDSIGEVKEEDMLVVWDNNALLRVDYFMWRYNFSNKKVVEHIDSVIAYVVIKRVIDLCKVSPDVISYAISHTNEETCGEILKELEIMGTIVKSIAKMQAVEKKALPAP